MFVKIFAKRCHSNIIDFKLFLVYIQDSEKMSESSIYQTVKMIIAAEITILSDL